MREHADPEPEPSLNIAPGLGNVLFDVWLVSRAVHALVDDAIRSAELDADEYAVYSVLASGDPMTPTELARWMAAPRRASRPDPPTTSSPASGGRRTTARSLTRNDLTTSGTSR
ncbi:MAG: hypothetical protein ACR2QO_22535 [Acidimicrobiales bacterium]